MLGIPPNRLVLDEPLPDDLPEATAIEGNRSRFELVVELARRERLTVRELLGRLGGGRGHRVVAGSAADIADTMQGWFDGGAADGFNVMPAVLPSGLQRFVEEVVPLLRERGLLRDGSAQGTLRERYGLSRPDRPGRWTAIANHRWTGGEAPG